MKTIIIVGCAMTAAALVAFAAGGAKMKISSSAFQEGGTIPEKFSKNGQNVSPELRVEGAPAEAKSLALIVDDPDAPVGLFTHWLVWNIDPKTTEIGREQPAKRSGPGHERLSKSWLRRAAAPLWYAPLLFQDLCSGPGARSQIRRETSGGRRCHARARDRPGRINGSLFEEIIDSRQFRISSPSC